MQINMVFKVKKKSNSTMLTKKLQLKLKLKKENLAGLRELRWKLKTN